MLVVDDIAFNQQVLVSLLGTLGIVPDVASDGLEAVNMFQTRFNKPCGCPNRAYGLVFMDI